MRIIPGLLLATIVLMFLARLIRTWHQIHEMEESAERVRLRYYFGSAVFLVIPVLIVFIVTAAAVLRISPLETPLVRRLFFICWNLSGIAGTLLALRASLPLKCSRDGYGLIVVHTGLLALLYMMKSVASTRFAS